MHVHVCMHICVQVESWGGSRRNWQGYGLQFWAGSRAGVQGCICLVFGQVFCAQKINNVCWINKWEAVFSRLEERLWWGRESAPTLRSHSASALDLLIHKPAQEQRPHPLAFLKGPRFFLPGPSCSLEREGSGSPEVWRRGSEGSGNCLSLANLLI